MQNLQNDLEQQKQNSRWWFQICFMFIPNYLGKIPILTIIFLNGLKSPTRLFLRWTASVCWAIYKAVYDICPEAQLPATIGNRVGKILLENQLVCLLTWR